MSIHDAREDFKGPRAAVGAPARVCVRTSVVTIEPLTPARRREMTRRHLLDAAALVFARDGFHGASLDDVAATAGFTKGAVYSNFKSKEDLFLALLDDRLAREHEGVNAALRAPHVDGRSEQLPRVQHVLEQLWDDEWTALYLEFVLYAKRNPAARERLARTFRQEYETAQQELSTAYELIDGTPNFAIPLLARVSVALFEGIALLRLVDPEMYDRASLTEALGFLYDTIGVTTPDETE